MDDIVSEFVEETYETLDELGAELVAWEKAPDDINLLNAIFRFFHTIKGSAGFLQLDAIGASAHAAEDLLELVRRGDRRADADLVNAVHKMIDDIMLQVAALGQGRGTVPRGGEDAAVAATGAVDMAMAATASAESTQAVIASDAQRSMRVSSALLNMLLQSATDLHLAANVFRSRLQASGAGQQLLRSFDAVHRLSMDVRAQASQMRMQRIERLYAPLPKAVRDLASQCGKLVDIRFEGGTIELDRDMLERLRDPLTHVVRNAIDHGIEPPAQRRAAGKAEVGQLTISASRAGNDVVLRIADDGAGLDPERIRKQALSRGLLDEGRGAMMDNAALLRLISTPGFSSRSTADAISGRGVGMDIVRANVEDIGGQLQIENLPGRGLCVIMTVPLSLSVVPCLLLRACGQDFVLPKEHVQQIWLGGNHGIRIEEVLGGRILVSAEGALPVISLGRLFCPADPGAERIADKVYVSVALPGGQRFAIEADDALEYIEAVIRPLPQMVTQVGPFNGVTLSDLGQPILLLDVAELGEQIQPAPETYRAVAPVADEAEDAMRFTIADSAAGERLAVPFSVVARIERFDPACVTNSGKQSWYRVGSRLLAFAARPEGLENARLVAILSSEDHETVLALRDIVNLEAVASDIRPAAGKGSDRGVIIWGGQALPLLGPPPQNDRSTASPGRRKERA